jgi:hypothetical protein
MVVRGRDDPPFQASSLIGCTCRVDPDTASGEPYRGQPAKRGRVSPDTAAAEVGPGSALATKGLPKTYSCARRPTALATVSVCGLSGSRRSQRWPRRRPRPPQDRSSASLLAGDPLSQRHATGRRSPHPRRALVRKYDCSSDRPPRSELPALWECSAATGWFERR